MANYIDPDFKPKDLAKLTEELLLVESYFKEFGPTACTIISGDCDFKDTNGGSKDV